MSLHHAIILNGLQELSNAAASGQRCRVGFQANGDEHWLVCTPNRIIMDWPFASPPSESEPLNLCFGGVHIEAWEADSYVRFIPMSKDVESLVAGIDRAFQELYGLGEHYTLVYKIEEG